MTDMWGGYINLARILQEKQFLNYTVNHSENFVDRFSGAYTQNIEGFWSLYKRTERKKELI